VKNDAGARLNIFIIGIIGSIGSICSIGNIIILLSPVPNLAILFLTQIPVVCEVYYLLGESSILTGTEFQMSLLMFVALAGYLIAYRVNQSAVVGIILCGIVVGPSSSVRLGITSGAG